MNWHMVRVWNKILKWLNPPFVKMQIKRGLYRHSSREHLTNINLSLASICSSDCIFCPLERSANIHQKFMPLALVEKIVREVRSRSFRKKHNIQIFSISENGDAFLNKEVIPILRLIRHEMPHVKIVCYTNFLTLTPDMIDIVLKENLLDFVGCNIDGATEETYFAVKKTNFKKVKEHLNYFIAMRRKWHRDIPLRVNVLTLFAYVHSIYNNFGNFPVKLKNKSIDMNKIRDDYQDVKKLIQPLLDHPKDKMVVLQPMGWAERSLGMQQKINYDHYSCPHLKRIKKEAFITSNGLWYACCFDANNELVLGDLGKQSMDEIFWSEKRFNLIKLLEKRQFQKVGGPCLTVNCCQSLKIMPSKK